MNVLTKTTNISPQRNFPLSILKGAAVNIGLQALGHNLSKDNFWQTLLVGAAGGVGNYLGGNTAMGAILGGGNAIINKSHFVGTTAKYAAWGAFADLVMKVAVAKAEPVVINKVIDPNGYLKRKGVNFIHAHCTNIKEWTSEDAGSADYNLTSDKLESKVLIAAFELAMSTKQFQTALQMFEDNANALQFVEYGNVKGYDSLGKSDIRIRTGNGLVSKTLENKKKCINNPQQCYCALQVSLYPEELADMPENKQIASMAVTIGHELFIHKGLNVVKLWKNGMYSDAWDMMSDYRGEHGNNDHKSYIQGKVPVMNQYLTELKAVASKTKVGVTAYDVQIAINNHDKKYLGLK